MKQGKKVLIVIALLLAISAVMLAKRASQQEHVGLLTYEDALASGLPVMVELGSDQCNACKLMVPILSELSASNSRDFRIAFIDVFKDKSVVDKFDIEVIPTQIFLDPAGNELYRHQGFYPKDDILARWKELGFDAKVN